MLQREETYLLTCAPNGDSNQSMCSHSLIWVFLLHIKKLCILCYPNCVQWRFWSELIRAAVNIIIFGLLNGLFLFLTLGSGTIEFPEFLMMMVRKVKAPDTPDELINAFSVFDYEKNGFISVQQLCHVMTNLGEKLSMAEMTEMIKQSGVDIHGQINYAGRNHCLWMVLCFVGQ